MNIDLARSEVSDDLFERAADGTQWAQPAIFCAALAGYELLKDRYERRSDLSRIAGLAEQDLAAHWQDSARFLGLAVEAWPKRLEALGR